MPCAEHTLCLLIQQIITVCRRHVGDDGLVPAQHLVEGTASLLDQVPPPRRMESRGEGGVGKGRGARRWQRPRRRDKPCPV